MLRVAFKVASLASSMKVLAKLDRSATSAVPDPVKYGSLSAAEVKPPIAARSASYPCTSEPIATPRAVLASPAVLDPVPPFATLKSLVRFSVVMFAVVPPNVVAVKEVTPVMVRPLQGIYDPLQAVSAAHKGANAGKVKSAIVRNDSAFLCCLKNFMIPP
jgi:hypothetical protein